ncbi:MAG: hypothetical protein H0T41_02165 [Rhodobacteraceae bacterium]|nr:hypothetical protein [Paracoccaceae bacterium]
MIYRASIAGGGEAEIRLSIAPEAATVADAWARLTAAYDDLDPTSLEIEIRQAALRPARQARDGGAVLARPAPSWPAKGRRLAELHR